MPQRLAKSRGLAERTGLIKNRGTAERRDSAERDVEKESSKERRGLVYQERKFARVNTSTESKGPDRECISGGESRLDREKGCGRERERERESRALSKRRGLAESRAL